MLYGIYVYILLNKLARAVCCNGGVHYRSRVGLGMAWGTRVEDEAPE